MTSKLGIIGPISAIGGITGQETGSCFEVFASNDVNVYNQFHQIQAARSGGKPFSSGK